MVLVIRFWYLKGQRDTVRINCARTTLELALIKWVGIDVGVAEMIIDGRVKVRNGVEIDHFVSNGVVFTDGSELEADTVIFAYVSYYIFVLDMWFTVPFSKGLGIITFVIAPGNYSGMRLLTRRRKYGASTKRESFKDVIAAPAIPVYVW